MLSLWNTLLLFPLTNLLIGFTKITGNFGWAIILVTIILRLALTPLILPGLLLGKKMQELSPELNALKNQFKDNKAGLAAAQAELYKKHGLNPTSGCLPQIIQLLILIALFNALNFIIQANGNLVDSLNPRLYSYNQLPANYQLKTKLWYLDMTKPDSIPGLPFYFPGIFLILSAVFQLATAKMMAPVLSDEKKQALKTSTETDDAMVAAQEQMLYLFPIMTILVGKNFSSGLVLYWLIFSVISMYQQYRIIGWGGLKPWLVKLRLLK